MNNYEHTMLSGYLNPWQITDMYLQGWRLIGLVAHPGYDREYHFERPINVPIIKE